MEERKEKNLQRKIEMAGFSQRLKWAMARIGITQSALASQVDLSQPHINNYLQGKSTPRTLVRQRLALALQVRYDWLLWGEGDALFKGDAYPVEDFWQNYSERLAYLLWNRSYNTLEFGDILDVTSNAVHMWCEGERMPTEDQWNKICEVLRTTYAWIRFGKGSPDPAPDQAHMDWVKNQYKLF